MLLCQRILTLTVEMIIKNRVICGEACVIIIKLQRERKVYKYDEKYIPQKLLHNMSMKFRKHYIHA